MAKVLLLLAVMPTACLLAAMVLRGLAPRSNRGYRKERGSWSLSPDSPLHAESRYRGESPHSLKR